MIDNTPKYAFTTQNVGLALQLKNSAHVVYKGKSVEATALWDTGATGSCISTSIVKELALPATGRMFIQTPSGKSEVSTYLVDIILPNNVMVIGVKVCESEIGNQGLDLLVGMDIIGQGDFAVSNFAGKTTFSFRMPSVKETDYVKELRLEKLIGPKHGPGVRKKKR